MRNHFQKLKKITEQGSISLCWHLSELALLHYISLDSLGWRRYWSEITIPAMLNGSATRQQPPLPFKRSTLYKAWKMLTERDILLIHADRRCFINLPMVIRTVYLSYGDTLIDAPTYKTELEQLFYQVSTDFTNFGFIQEVVKLPTSDEIMRQLGKNTQRRAEIRLEKTPTKPFTPTVLFGHFVRIFKNHGIECMPFLPTHDKTAYYSTITNLKKLGATFESNQDCLEFLTNCAKMWGYLCTHMPRELVFGHADISNITNNIDTIHGLLRQSTETPNLLIMGE